MLQQRFRAMGTEVVAVASATAGLDAVRARFERVEACCSRFRPESELSRANADPAGAVRVSPLLSGALSAAAAVRSLTGGLVDAGVGQALLAWGYDRTFAEIGDLDAAPAAVPGGPAWEVEGRTLRRAPGTLLDLGGVAKGWTCDRAVEAGHALVVSAGGDVRSADGRTEVEVLGIGDAVAARLHLGVGALATSSTLRRRWQAGGEPAHHLIDPRTMAPARSPVVSATAVAATALEAEAGAKALLLLGEDGLAWAEGQPWMRGALVVWHDGSVFATTGTRVAA
jgi:thiamine biosynthesis lipoprotein